MAMSHEDGPVIFFNHPINISMAVTNLQQFCTSSLQTSLQITELEEVGQGGVGEDFPSGSLNV